MPQALPDLHGHAGDRRRGRRPRARHQGAPGRRRAALAISFGTHYAADRRVPGEGLLEKLATKTGKGGFYKLADFGMNGAFHLDSAWHHGWETVAAVVATTKATSR